MVPSKTWVIASPRIDTYEGFPLEEIPEIYAAMASEDFDEQFTQIEDAKTIVEIVPFSYHSLKGSVAYIELKREKIDVDVKAWHNVPVYASLHSFIYTLGSLPLGEAIYIENTNPNVRIMDGLKKFYEDHLWCTKANNQQSDFLKVPNKMLNNVLIGEFFSLCNQKYLI